MKPMKLEVGKLHVNQTYKYLAEVLTRSLPKEFVSMFVKYDLHNCVNGWFIDDLEYQEAVGGEYLLFCVVDINGKFNNQYKRYESVRQGRKNFYEFLEYFKKSKHGFYDYVYDDLRMPHRHVLVFNLIKFKGSYDFFKTGSYSKMFDKDQLKELNITNRVTNSRIKLLYNVLTKNEEARSTFEERVNNKFKSQWKMPHDYEGEYDVYPIMKEEILNYKTDEKTEIQNQT